MHTSDDIVQISRYAPQSAQYIKTIYRKTAILTVLAVLLFLSFVFDLAIGPSQYAFSEVLNALFFSDSSNEQIKTVLWEIRMPVALMAVLVGASLSVSGAQMQTILNNPLASPFTLGISAAASFGAALALAFGVKILPGISNYIVPLNAFFMAALSALLIFFLSKRRGATTETVVLLGIALVFSFNSLLAAVQYFASEQAVAAVVFWTMGSLTKATWGKLAFVGLSLVFVLPIFFRRVWVLTSLRLGDEKAASFGVNVGYIRLETLILTSLLAALPVAFVGTIGFIGLVGPHIARMIIGEDQRFFLPASLLMGSLILSLSSILSKTLISGAIFPIGIVTSIIGIPVFFSLILASKKA